MDDETQREQATPEVQARIRASFERQGLTLNRQGRWERFLHHLKAGPAGGLRPGDDTTSLTAR
jgi:hypothetical protein